MTKRDVLKDEEFEAVTETSVDAKHRVTLGKLIGPQITSFRVYRNAHGQIVLDPLVSVPAHEAWLFQNKQAFTQVREGLADAKQGRLVKAKEDYAKYTREDT